jgi:hypothetical protein
LRVHILRTVLKASQEDRVQVEIDRYAKFGEAYGELAELIEVPQESKGDNKASKKQKLYVVRQNVAQIHLTLTVENARIYLKTADRGTEEDKIPPKPVTKAAGPKVKMVVCKRKIAGWPEPPPAPTTKDQKPRSSPITASNMGARQ